MKKIKVLNKFLVEIWQTSSILLHIAIKIIVKINSFTVAAKF